MEKPKSRKVVKRSKSAANAKRHSTGRKRTSLEIEADKEFIYDLSIKGYTSREISKMYEQESGVKLSHVAICNDIKKIKLDLKTGLSLEVSGHIAEQLAGIKIQKKELWQAWEKSKKKAIKIVTTIITGKGGRRKSVQNTEHDREGERQFQAELTKLNNQEQNLLGMRQPQRKVLNDEKGKPLEFVIRLSEAELP